MTEQPQAIAQAPPTPSRRGRALSGEAIITDTPGVPESPALAGTEQDTPSATPAARHVADTVAR